MTLEEFYKVLYSPYWWISVMVTGVLASVLAAYFRDAIDKIFSFFSKRFKQNSLNRKEKEQKQIEEMIGNRDAQVDMFFNEIRSVLQSIVLLILSAVSFGLSMILDSVMKAENIYIATGAKMSLFLLSLLTNLVGLSLYIKASSNRSMIREAQEREKNIVRNNKTAP